MDKHQVEFTVSTQTVVKILAILFLAFFIYYIRDVILIFLTSVVIASAIEPGTQWLVQRRVPRILSVVIIYVIVVTLFALVAYFIVPPFLRDLGQFINTIPDYLQQINVGRSDAIAQSNSLAQTVQNIASSLSSASGSIIGTLSAVFGGALSFIFILVISFYLAVREGGIEDFLRVVTPFKHEKYVISLWQRTQLKIGRWMQGQLVLALIVGVLVYIGLTLLGIQNALLLAFIAMVFEIIPAFGQIIGAIPGILIAVLQGGLPLGLIVLLMYVIVQQIEGHIIYPLVVKKLVDIHPIIVIIALIIGAKIGGFLGILLSVPVAAALGEYLSDVNERRIAAREQYAMDHRE